MLIFTLFTALFPLLIVAVPLPAHDHPTEEDYNPRKTLYRRAPPKFEIPYGYVRKPQQKDTLDKMMEHYNTESTDEQKGAGLASAVSRWRKLPAGREYMNFNYHAGDDTNSPVIGPPAIIFRGKPVPKMHFHGVGTPHQEEMKTEGMKRYNDLSDERASKVKAMKAWGEWDNRGGMTEKTKFTFHSAAEPNAKNIIGTPITMQRPLTLQFGNVPPLDKIAIENDVRVAHSRVVADERHPASKSNYGIIYSGWHDSSPDESGRMHKQVMVGLDEVSEDEKQKRPIGFYAIRKSTSDHESPGLHTGSPILHTVTSPAHPSIGQEERASNVDSPSMNALSSNTGPSHPSSQGTSQFDAGSPGPSSHPGSSHSESSH